MSCTPEVLKDVPLFALLDDDELAVLSAQVEMRRFAARHRIYRMGDPGERAYVMLSGRVQVTTVDADNQDVVVDEPARGQFFGFASMLEQSPHETNAATIEPTVCLEITRDNILTLLMQKPHSGMDMLRVLGHQIHAAQQLVRGRTARNPNEIIESKATIGDRISDAVANFGGSWTFILTFIGILVVYTAINVILGTGAWDPYPFILLNLFLSMLAAFQAPVIMMSQNRQDQKDRLRGELDFDVNRRAEAEIQALARKLNLVVDKIDDLETAITSLGRSF
jgi:CRP/FNR family transcriptional regulator, cyclic AMP receptor protein